MTASSRRAREAEASHRAEASRERAARMRIGVASASRPTRAAGPGRGAATSSRQVRAHLPAAVPVSATTLARRIDGADVPMPNVLSARHLARIGGGLLYAATSNVPWATLLARAFEVDVQACARCAGRLEVRAVVTDHDIFPTTARAPPIVDTPLVDEPAFARPTASPWPRTSFA
jgi:hypothetical protein